MDRVVVRGISRCRVARVFYTAWCDDAGKVIDDGTVARLREDRFRMTAAVPNLYWLQENAFGLDVGIEDVSDALAGLALQGPTSRALLQELTSADPGALCFLHRTRSEVAGAPALITRTGCTGDLGYEIFVAPEDAEKLWDSIMELRSDFKMRPAGCVTLELTRIEGGYCSSTGISSPPSRPCSRCRRCRPTIWGGVGWSSSRRTSSWARRRFEARGRKDPAGPRSLWSSMSPPWRRPTPSATCRCICRTHPAVAGLYLCGAGSHPGGGISGLPGRNAAREILKDA